MIKKVVWFKSRNFIAINCVVSLLEIYNKNVESRISLYLENKLDGKKRDVKNKMIECIFRLECARMQL